MPTRKTVAIAFLGTTLDRGPKGERRWELWRPTVSLCQQPQLPIDRLELLASTHFADLTQRVIADIAKIAPETEVRSHPIDLADAWDFEEVYGTLLDFSRAYKWNTDREDYLLHITTGTHVAQICMFLLAEARYLPAKLIQTSPPTKHNRDPRGSHRVIDLDLSKYDTIASRFHKVHSDDLSFLKSGIETRSARFNALIEQIERVAIASRDPMLLLGPTGAGKSHLARRIYELKRSRNQIGGAFVDVNCATIRGDGAMSALFGHSKGAYTGAAQARDGMLVSADKGMLFLDEIGELGLDEQAMLLRAIEEKCFFPVGSDKEVKSDFQLIAGTNRDLRSAVHSGAFRADLLSRIDLWCFKLPGLRERLEDIAPNLEYELERYSARHNVRVSFNKEAREKFLKFATAKEATWSANFRDLGAAVTRMATLAESGRISTDVVDGEMERLQDSWRVPEGDDEHELCRHFQISPKQLAAIDRFDRVQLLDVLRVCRSSRTLAEAGRELFAVSRTSRSKQNDSDRLRKYLARFEIEWPM